VAELYSEGRSEYELIHEEAGSCYYFRGGEDCKWISARQESTIKATLSDLVEAQADIRTRSKWNEIHSEYSILSESPNLSSQTCYISKKGCEMVIRTRVKKDCPNKGATAVRIKTIDHPDYTDKLSPHRVDLLLIYE